MDLKMKKPLLLIGEDYAGTIIHKDGSGEHIILMGHFKDNLTWNESVAWAKEHGGDLPNRVESALLCSELKEKFIEDWYWTDELYSAKSEFAWSVHLTGGGLHMYEKCSEKRACVIRRVSIMDRQYMQNQSENKTAGQVAYEEELLIVPSYEDGQPRRPWEKLGKIEQASWENNPHPRFTDLKGG